ncbi:hypothetical protein CHLRE_12g526264v5 [Chlamydomonas reinhardtii]|uniref:Uncharacterized protein n=1 Tax=Chlamydomonas reinhardtii TaxID=3055 RepID=A0A2K3D4G2_CHLRE|nr:uncharacterized protein CHLRE_12g526264v5 [Chlamydomonas reinhardtii]PNW75423.1 hypothetical protein CHLRE_12g526264v5 [Chlamydomonas reinhardtii]
MADLQHRRFRSCKSESVEFFSNLDVCSHQRNVAVICASGHAAPVPILAAATGGLDFLCKLLRGKRHILHVIDVLEHNQDTAHAHSTALSGAISQAGGSPSAAIPRAAAAACQQFAAGTSSVLQPPELNVGPLGVQARSHDVHMAEAVQALHPALVDRVKTLREAAAKLQAAPSDAAKQAARRAFMNAKGKVAGLMVVVDTMFNENSRDEVLALLSTSEVARAATTVRDAVASIQAVALQPAHVNADANAGADANANAAADGATADGAASDADADEAHYGAASDADGGEANAPPLPSGPRGRSFAAVVAAAARVSAVAKAAAAQSRAEAAEGGEEDVPGDGTVVVSCGAAPAPKAAA